MTQWQTAPRFKSTMWGLHMRTYLNRTRAIAAVGATAVLSCTGLALPATDAAQAATAVPTVTVHMSNSKITFSGSGAKTSNGVTTLHAGRYNFHVVTKSGDHSLQLLRFRHGYDAQQAGQDLPKAFSGNIPAIHRVDHGIVFRGGAEAKANHPGDMIVTLNPQQYAAVDTNGNAFAQLKVVGKMSKLPAALYDGSYHAYSYGWGVSSHLPASGYVKFSNNADQPHFLVLQHVKKSTTDAQVRKFIKSQSQGNPPWGLKETAQAGVVSPNQSQLLKYDLPAGKYLIACFWPDYFTGMPHFYMGMWKLVTLS